MNTDKILDKYSKISIIVIAVILLIGFFAVTYSKVWMPYREQLSQRKQQQENAEAFKKRQENRELLDECYANAQAASEKRRDENCTTKADDSTYFYCNPEFVASNLAAEKEERKNCEAKYLYGDKLPAL